MTDAKRGRGQPSKGELARNKLISVRLTEAEHTAVESAANSTNTSPANWMRDRALEALGEATSPDLALELANRELAKLRALRDELDTQLETALERLRQN